MNEELLQCTCEAPAGAAHNPGCPLASIWTPPEKVDDNTKRMAWLMFLETWKKEWDKVIEQPKEALEDHAEFTYERCLIVAKTVRAIELKS